jgi:hypothetical protein
MDYGGHLLDKNLLLESGILCMVWCEAVEKGPIL